MSEVHATEVEILNRLGLHARPAAQFVRTSNRFRADVFVAKDGVEVNGKSIMGVMMLAAEYGARIEIRAAGADAREAVEALARLVRAGFYEDDEGHLIEQPEAEAGDDA